MIYLNNNTNCLIDLLTTIDTLQKEAVNPIQENEGCLRPLGTLVTQYNTRPVSFFLCDNSELVLNYYEDGTVLTSNVFRIEDIDGSCVVVRLLATEADGTFTATSETALVNVSCICAIRCLGDIFLEL